MYNIFTRSDHYIVNRCCKRCGDLSVFHIRYLLVFSFDWQVKLLRICTPHSYGSLSVLFLAVYMMDYLWALSPLSGLPVVRSVYKSMKVWNASLFDTFFFNVAVGKSFAGVHRIFSLCVEIEKVTCGKKNYKHIFP